jgi:hypothetical protein
LQQLNDGFEAALHKGGLEAALQQLKDGFEAALHLM